MALLKRSLAFVDEDDSKKSQKRPKKANQFYDFDDNEKVRMFNLTIHTTQLYYFKF